MISARQSRDRDVRLQAAQQAGFYTEIANKRYRIWLYRPLSTETIEGILGEVFTGRLFYESMRCRIRIYGEGTIQCDSIELEDGSRLTLSDAGVVETVYVKEQWHSLRYNFRGCRNLKEFFWRVLAGRITTSSDLLGGVCHDPEVTPS